MTKSTELIVYRVDQASLAAAPGPKSKALLDARPKGEKCTLRASPGHAIVLEADEFDATKQLLVETFGLTPAIEQEGWALFPMPNGTILDLYAPGAIPAYGFNEGIVFGFRVQDIEAASAELAAARCKLLGEITRIDEMRYAFRHFRGPDGRVYGINEQK